MLRISLIFPSRNIYTGKKVRSSRLNCVMAKCQIYFIDGAANDILKIEKQEGENIKEKKIMWKFRSLFPPNLLSIMYETHEKLKPDISQLSKGTMDPRAEFPFQRVGGMCWWILFWCLTSKRKTFLSPTQRKIVQWKMMQMSLAVAKEKIFSECFWKINLAIFFIFFSFCHSGSNFICGKWKMTRISGETI